MGKEIEATRMMLIGNNKVPIEVAFLESINENLEKILMELQSTKTLFHELTNKF